MIRAFGSNFDRSPTLDEFHTLAEKAFDELPEAFRRLCGNVIIHVSEEAEAGILREMKIANPLELSGLFEGVGLPEQSVSDPTPFPNHVHLYRRSILHEWRGRKDVTLEDLVKHVLVHEIGHHFGLSDEDMHRIEDEARD